MDEIAVETPARPELMSVVRASWAVIRDHWFSLTVAASIRDLTAVLSGGIVFAILVDRRGWNLTVAVGVGILVWFTMNAGYLKLCLNLCKTNRVNWADLITGASYGIPLVISFLLMATAVSTGAVLLVIPGVVLYVCFCFYQFALIDQRLDPVGALLTSIRLAKGNFWNAFLLLTFFCVVAFIPYLGALAVWSLLQLICLCTLYIRITDSAEVTQ